tara:strand:- start:295 stop:471 length:177 start_codon:yes stop_codon:yes gene_type:complete
LAGEVITGEGRLQEVVTQLRISVLYISHNLFLCIDDGAGALTTAGATPGGISLLVFGP